MKVRKGKLDATDTSGEEKALKQFETLYGDYLKRLNETSDATTKRILDAQKAYVDAGTKASWESAEELRKAADAASREYLDAVRAAWEDSQKEYTAAYDNYVGGFRDAMQAGHSPALVTVAMQSGSAAAGYAAATIGNWQLISWSGVPPEALAPESAAAAT